MNRNCHRTCLNIGLSSKSNQFGKTRLQCKISQRKIIQRIKNYFPPNNSLLFLFFLPLPLFRRFPISKRALCLIPFSFFFPKLTNSIVFSPEFLNKMNPHIQGLGCVPIKPKQQKIPIPNSSKISRQPNEWQIGPTSFSTSK